MNRTFTGAVFVNNMCFTADAVWNNWKGNVAREEMIQALDSWIDEWHHLDPSATQELQDILNKGRNPV